MIKADRERLLRKTNLISLAAKSPTLPKRFRKDVITSTAFIF